MFPVTVESKLSHTHAHTHHCGSQTEYHSAIQKDHVWNGPLLHPDCENESRSECTVHSSLDSNSKSGSNSGSFQTLGGELDDGSPPSSLGPKPNRLVWLVDERCASQWGAGKRRMRMNSLCGTMPTVCCATTPRLSPETVLGFTAWVLWSDLLQDADDQMEGEGKLERLEREREPCLDWLVGWNGTEEEKVNGCGTHTHDENGSNVGLEPRTRSRRMYRHDQVLSNRGTCTCLLYWRTTAMADGTRLVSCYLLLSQKKSLTQFNSRLFSCTHRLTVWIQSRGNGMDDTMGYGHAANKRWLGKDQSTTTTTGNPWVFSPQTQGC